MSIEELKADVVRTAREFAAAAVAWNRCDLIHQSATAKARDSTGEHGTTVILLLSQMAADAASSRARSYIAEFDLLAAVAQLEAALAKDAAE